jgi:hypothetical protein
MFGRRRHGPEGASDDPQGSQSILDAVNSDIKRLRVKVGGTDRGKIDQYLEALRDVERRMQLAEKQDIPRSANRVSCRRAGEVLRLLHADGRHDDPRNGRPT